MSSKSRDESFDEQPRQSAQASQFPSSDELIAFAQSYFATDFANPERLGCPVEGALSGLVRSGKIPDDHLLSHMFSCSECFSQYQNALAAYRAEMKAAAGRAQIHSWRDKLLLANLLRPLPIFAAALSLVCFALIGAFIWREYHAAREQIVLKRGSSTAAEPPENPSTIALPPATAEASPPIKPVERNASSTLPKQTRQQKEPEPHQGGRASTDAELIAMSIDLRDYALTRGGANLVGGAGGDPLTVAPARTRMTLTLPEGSSKGFYTVSVVDASGNALETRNASSVNGKTLAATMNMQRLAHEKYWLRISHKGEPPINIPIVVRPFKKP